MYGINQILFSKRNNRDFATNKTNQYSILPSKEVLNPKLNTSNVKYKRDKLVFCNYNKMKVSVQFKYTFTLMLRFTNLNKSGLRRSTRLAK